MVTEEIGKRILVVDDVTKNIQLVASFLKQAGYDIYFALNGQTAIKHVKNIDFDLVLLDIMMPEVDGLEVCQQIKANHKTKDIPVIFLTAKTDADSVAKAYQSGGVDYITKPFNRSELLARVKTHLELQTQRNNLVELNATKDKFFSIIAHDLKSPLNQLLGLSRIIQTEIETGSIDEVIRMTGHLGDSAKSARLLVENLLEWSRSQTGTINFNPEELDLSKITEEVVALNEQNAIQRHIKIVSKIKKDFKVRADANMIKTVLRNLISNGIKFTNRGGRIKLTAERNKDKIIYTVKDTGIGMKPEDLTKLFRIDINPNTIGNSGEKGTGLGLILCKEFVEMNGGSIWVESELYEGSAFSFSIPSA